MADTLIWCRTAGPQEVVDNSTTTFKSLPPGLGILVECSRWVQVCENVQEVQIVQATCRRPIVTLLVAATAFSSKMHFLETWLVGYLCGTLVQDTCRIEAVKLQWLNLGPPWTTLDHLGPPWTTLDHLGPPWTTLGHLGPPWIPILRHRRRSTSPDYLQRIRAGVVFSVASSDDHDEAAVDQSFVFVVFFLSAWGVRKMCDRWFVSTVYQCF